MACTCIKCGSWTTCGEKYCEQCMVEECFKTDVDKNLALRGRFYPSVQEDKCQKT